MKNSLTALLVIGTILAAAGPARCYDISGDSWYGWLGVDVTSGNPSSQSGEVTGTATSFVCSYTVSNGTSETWEVTDITAYFDADGWLVVDGMRDGSPWIQRPASNDDITYQVSKVLGEGTSDEWQMMSLRKDFGLTDTDVIGEYGYFGQSLDVSSPGFSTDYGVMTFNADHSYVAPGETGSWSLDGLNSRIQITTPSEGSKYISAGQGGLGMYFDIDPIEGDDLGFGFLVKKTTGRTADEVAGHYLMQGFYSDDAGDYWTVWGTVDIYSDTSSSGTYSVNANDGTDDVLISGSFTMDDDGTMHITEDITGYTRVANISLDSDLMVVANTGGPSDSLGVTYLIRADMAGDVDGDGWVSGDDLSTVITYWGQSGLGREYGDLDGSGTVDGSDYTEVITYWGNGSPAPLEPTGIPEPGTVGLMLVGSLALLRGRRRFGG